MNFYLLQNYFTKILEDNLKAIIKPQYVDHIPKVSVAINMRLYGIVSYFLRIVEIYFTSYFGFMLRIKVVNRSPVELHSML
jgi:hypothetical protein